MGYGQQPDRHANQGAVDEKDTLGPGFFPLRPARQSIGEKEDAADHASNAKLIFAGCSAIILGNARPIVVAAPDVGEILDQHDGERNQPITKAAQNRAQRLRGMRVRKDHKGMT